MRLVLHTSLALCLAASSAIAFAQDAPIRQERLASPVVAGQKKLPYTAEFKTTRTQTLADGSTITHEATEIMARDAEGRTVNIRIANAGLDSQGQQTMVNTYDPGTRTHTFWSVPGQSLTINTDASPAGRTGCSASNRPELQQRPSSSDRPKPEIEDLKTQTFLGVEARGHRTTVTFPAGTIGNSDQLVRTDEVWFSISPGLAGINVRQINEDPQNGRNTREMVRFTQGDPDPSLFTPPDGYETITRETHEEIRCP